MDIAIGEDEFPVILLYDDMKVMYSKSMKCLFCRIHLLWRPGPLMTWTLTPEFWLPELWRLVAFTAFTHIGSFDAPDFWRREAIGPFDAPGLWRPNNLGVAFDAPTASSGIWRPNTVGWHLTPHYLQVAFDAPIPSGGIWRPNNPWVAFDAGNNFSDFFFKIFESHFLDSIFWIPFLGSHFSDPHLGFFENFRGFSKPTSPSRTWQKCIWYPFTVARVQH